MEFKDNLKYLRKRENFTQEELAEKLNVSRQAVTKWESGQSMPDIENVKEIAIYFGVTTDELLGTNKMRNDNVSLQRKIRKLPVVIITIVLEFCFYIVDWRIPKKWYIVYVPIFVIALSMAISFYFKTGKKEILDLTDTKEGKKFRRKYIAKKATFTCLKIFTLIYIPKLITGIIFKRKILDYPFEYFIIVLLIAWVASYDFTSMIIKKQVEKFNKEK